MSEMGSDSDRLLESIMKFTECIGDALPDICSYGLTYGESYVPFTPDEDEGCDNEEAACSQAWVRVERGGIAYEEDSFGSACGGVITLTLEVGVLRCVSIPEDGEAPTASDAMLASLQSLADMRAIHCAAMGCEVWDSIVSGNWRPLGPLGGQFGGVWQFTIEV